MKKLRPPIKTFSGKYYLASWIIENFPKEYSSLEYCDFCCGGCSIFLNKKKSSSEFINDKDIGITSIFKALRDDHKEFVKCMKKIKYNENTFKKAFEKNEENNFADYYDFALNEFVLRRMSRNGLKKSFAWTNRVRGGQPGDVNAWKTMIEQLPIIAERLQDVIITNEKFQDIISFWDEENVFMFVDPPTLPEATDGSTNELENEMCVEEHIKFLNIVKYCKAKVMICGYDSILYSKNLTDWKVFKKKVVKKNYENEKQYSLWVNY